MFGSKKLKEEIIKLKAENLQLKNQINYLRAEWNILVRKVNRKGGEEFLVHGVLPRNINPEFSQSEIKMMIKLCHPDKHNQNPDAVAITQTLLNLRKK